MIYTARQLQEVLAKNGGTLRLPLGSRLTPAGNDWVRSRRLTIEFDSTPSPGILPSPGTPGEGQGGGLGCEEGRGEGGAASRSLLWWSDGPCGHAKAALSSMTLPVRPVAEGQSLASALRHLAGQVSDAASCAALLVKHGSAAAILANRCPAIRAFVATGLDTVEAAVRDAAANTIIIEYPRHALTAIRSMLAAFVRGQRSPSAELLGQLKELASCV